MIGREVPLTRAGGPRGLSLGQLLRAALGPLEYPVSLWSRLAFFDADGFARQLAASVPARRILEIGCGVGHLTESLSRAFPTATICAIDPFHEAGRLFRGDRGRVEFRREGIDATVHRQGAAFDLVVLGDVLHHVPIVDRRPLLTGVCRTLAPGGVLVVKDWQPTYSLIHFLAWLSDRIITGDRVTFLTPARLAMLLVELLPEAKVEALRLRRWPRNNYALVLRTR